MKYTALKNSDVKSIHIDVPKKGMDTVGEDILKDSLRFCKNVIYKDNTIKTRKGINTKEENRFDLSMARAGNEFSYEITDAEHFFNNENRRIAFARVDYSETHYFIMVYSIGKKCDIMSLGYIHFQASDETSFYIPENVTFIVAEPQIGAGIFALVSLKSKFDETKKDYVVYEMISASKPWSRFFDFYIPTVLINGRGNAYENALSSMPSIAENPPLFLENRNILNGAFYSYYTSDNYSFSFEIPFKELDNKSVICRIYCTPTAYDEWVVYEGETSDEITYFGQKVKMTVDREKGIVSFKNSEGDFPIEYSPHYPKNNIRILASKEGKSNYRSIISCKACVSTASGVFLACGNDKNKVFYADYGNPFYFAEVSDNQIGVSESEIYAIKYFKNSLYVFRDGGIYSLKMKNSGYFNTGAILTDNSRSFKKPNSFSVSEICRFSGFVDRKTVDVLDDSLIFYGDHRIYALKNSKVYNVGSKIESLLGELNEPDFQGVVFKNQYILMNENKLIVLCFNDELETGCYYWELPLSIFSCGILAGSDSPLIIYSNGVYGFVADFSSRHDVIFETYDESQNYEIESEIDLNTSINLQDKTVKKVVINADIEDNCQLMIGDSRYSLNKSMLGDSYKIITDCRCFKDFTLRLKGKSGITFKGADIYYNE